MTDKRLARLIGRARRGDVAAFGRLYDEYADRVYAFVRFRTGSAHDAEDVTATVFLKAWESIGSYNERGVPFSAWLFRIARNAAIDEYRKSEHRPVPMEELPPAEERVDSPELRVIANADAGRLRAAVAGLTADQGAVIALRYWSDLSTKETATALGKNENTVKQLQHRAIKSLARMLEEGETNDHD